LQALIDHTKSKSNEVAADVVLVISNVADVAGLKRAEAAGIPTKVTHNRDVPLTSF
jgi:folate-dependent phosphoribosylglycinamide formyltransferase PurN